MVRTPAVRKLVLIWLAWVVILFAYQGFVTARYKPQRPDYARSWTVRETGIGAQNDKPYLLEPFLNEHVSWDSEFYIGVADAGYDNANIRSIPGPGPDGKLSMSYAFFPLYPFLMRLLTAPLAIFGLSRLAAITLAGVTIAVLGTLAAMIALYDLSRDWLGEDGGVRAAFYLLIFPTGFFLAQVYTEGLFLGLTFTALALIHRRRLLWAALPAALAVWTRAVGVVLVIPLAMVAWQEIREKGAPEWFSRRTLTYAAAAAAPLASLFGWWLTPLRPRFQFVEENNFGRGFLLIGQTLGDWLAFFQQLGGREPQMVMYNALEIVLTLLALAACIALLRKMPVVAWLSLAVFIISAFSGSAQSVSRYVLAVPALFIGLSRLGENEVFDKSWTLASLLWMATQVTLFSFDLWVD